MPAKKVNMFYFVRELGAALEIQLHEVCHLRTHYGDPLADQAVQAGRRHIVFS